ncbi:MAG TPA: metal-dependent transcriptional regulator [Gemmatimonadales bacterium]
MTGESEVGSRERARYIVPIVTRGPIGRQSSSGARRQPIYTPVVEDYLKTIWKLQQQGDAAVSTSRIAEQLGLTAAAVTAMVKRLAEQRLVSHEPYYGVRLTGAGELAALRIIRRHRVLELFLQEVLGYEWDRVHDEAERLEHAASDELIERLAKLLGDPARDPHGAAIPSAEGEIDRVPHPLLAEVGVGRQVRVLEVMTGDAEHLRYLGSLELYPGAEVEVTARAPFDGPLTLSVNGSAHVLDHAMAARIRVMEEEPGGN